MSKIDDTFGSIATRQIGKWGSIGTVVRTGVEVRDKETGTISVGEERIEAKMVVFKLTSKEYEGLYQATDVKVLVDPAPIGDQGIKVGDWFEYQQNGSTVKAIVVDPDILRGDHIVSIKAIARPE